MYDTIIIGSGPSGLTAGIYTTRANLKTLIIAGVTWGGQLMLTTEVENFPGFPDGIMGPDLMQNMRKQAERHGAEIIDVPAISTDFSTRPFIVRTDEKEYQAKSIILATGADAKWLDVPGEKERIGRGVSSCATCDAAFFRNKRVIIVGGGDSAMEEALVLASVAEKVTIIHRRDTFTASHVMQTRVLTHPKIEVRFHTVITEIKGEGKVEAVQIEDTQTKQVSELPIHGVFVAIGHIPNSNIFEGITTDERGYILSTQQKTNIEGVFTAGDVHDYHYRQAITAAGYGCMAALEAERWLQLQG